MSHRYKLIESRKDRSICLVLNSKDFLRYSKGIKKNEGWSGQSIEAGGSKSLRVMKGQQVVLRC